jgi:acyl-CoA synthetase (NDP forming)
MRSADSDNPSWRQRQRRRQADIDFLAKLRVAEIGELMEMLKSHTHKSTPEWKRVAILRAIKRQSQ